MGSTRRIRFVLTAVSALAAAAALACSGTMSAPSESHQLDAGALADRAAPLDAGPRIGMDARAPVAGEGGRSAAAGTASPAGRGSDAAVAHDAASDAARDAAAPQMQYPAGPPGCGLSAAAFCDTFDQIAATGLGEGRAGELDPRAWSGARMQPGLNFGPSATPVRAATIPSCRPDLPSRVYPDQDALICDGNERIQSRHLLMAAAEQSYGQLSLRIRRPFDFADRTGTVVFDAEGELTGFLQGWVSVAITAEPTPAPSFGIMQNFENGAVPRNGVEVHLFQICGADDRVGVAQVNVFRDYAETFYLDDEGGRSPTCVRTERGTLNHFELRISRSHLELWGSDRSPDGVTFGPLTRLFALDVELPFERGYVHINTHNHSSLKYSEDKVDAWVARWDNVGFDGPVIGGLREHSLADALEPVVIDGVDCRNIGYQLGDVAEGPRQTFTFRAVDPGGVTAAKIALVGHFNTHTDVPFADYALRYRVNAGGWQELRFDSAQLALLSGPLVYDESGTNVRGDGTGIAGAIALMLDVDPASLLTGDNSLQLVTSGIPNSYRPYAANIDLVLATQ
jgi:hypothetical protein